MDKFTEYQEQSRVFAQYPTLGYDFVYLVMGLTGEAGEVSEKFKKISRDKNGVISESDKIDIIQELGDVTWYLSQLCDVLDIEYSEIHSTNIDKLTSRLARNKISGSGDNR